MLNVKILMFLQEANGQRVLIGSPRYILDNRYNKQDKIDNYHQRKEDKTYDEKHKESGDNPIEKKADVKIHDIQKHCVFLGSESLLFENVVDKYTEPSSYMWYEYTRNE